MNMDACVNNIRHRKIFLIVSRIVSARQLVRTGNSVYDEWNHRDSYFYQIR